MKDTKPEFNGKELYFAQMYFRSALSRKPFLNPESDSNQAKLLSQLSVAQREYLLAEVEKKTKELAVKTAIMKRKRHKFKPLLSELINEKRSLSLFKMIFGLYNIENRKKINQLDIANSFEVSVATIRRDMDIVIKNDLIVSERGYFPSRKGLLFGKYLGECGL